MIKRPELLAPAGSPEMLRAAVDHGADAVYLGLGSMNARANATNFEGESLLSSLEYAHVRGVRSYLTLNTLLRDDEFPEAVQTARMAYESGMDAIIVQDIGLLRVLHENLPGIPIHASTQMNLFQDNFENFVTKYGISRVVLPRELSLEEISQRTREAARYGVETEVFVHGALCVSYSGLCLFSAMNGNGLRSGNRGLCAQPCRTRFAISGSNGKVFADGRLLSPKDQCALSSLATLVHSGVSSLKIEGRMRDAAYVAATVKVYRKAIDNLLSGNVSESSEEDREELLQVYNRGGSFTSRYMTSDFSSEYLSGDYPGRFGILIGNIIKKDAKAGTITIRPDNTALPQRGDYLSIRKENAEIASFPIGSCEKRGDLLWVKGLHPHMIDKLPDQSSVYRMSDRANQMDLLSGKDAVKTPVNARFDAGTSDLIQVTLSVSDGRWKDTSVSSELPLHTDDSYPVLSRDRMESQLGKMKSSPFQLSVVQYADDIILRVPVSAINEVRRDLTDKLARKILEKSVHTFFSDESVLKQDLSIDNVSHRKVLVDGYLVRYRDLSVIDTDFLAVGADYYGFSVFDIANEKYTDALVRLFSIEPDARFLIDLPSAYKGTLQPLINQAIEITQRNLSGHFQGFLRSGITDCRQEDFVSASANLYNAKAVITALQSAPAALQISYERSESDTLDILAEVRSAGYAEFAVILHRYGRIEWMQSAFCPVGRNVPGCRTCHSKRKFSLRVLKETSDDTNSGKELSIVTHPEVCSTEILGSCANTFSETTVEQVRRSGLTVIESYVFYDEDYDTRINTINKR